MVCGLCKFVEFVGWICCKKSEEIIHADTFYCIKRDISLWTTLCACKLKLIPAWTEGEFKGTNQCYYTSLSFVNIDHIGHKNPTHFSQNSLISEISCLFTFCSCSVNVIESKEYVTTLVKKNVYVKILLHANSRARKAELVRNNF